MTDKLYFCPFVLLEGPWDAIEEQIENTINNPLIEDTLKKRVKKISDSGSYKRNFFLFVSQDETTTLILIDGCHFSLATQCGVVIPEWELDNIEMHLQKARSGKYQPIVKKEQK